MDFSPLKQPFWYLPSCWAAEAQRGEIWAPALILLALEFSQHFPSLSMMWVEDNFQGKLWDEDVLGQFSFWG